MQVETKCGRCGKTFRKQSEEGVYDSSHNICYDCALESITGGQPPEEGDFNTARIQSGEISDEGRRILQEDLRSVDWAACQPDPENEEGHDCDSWHYDQ